VLLSPTLVLIPSGLVTLASVAIPSLLAQEATARSSCDQQLRAQPGSRALLLKIIITLQSSKNLHNHISDSLNLKPSKNINYIYIYILSFALSKPLMVFSFLIF
jgi:hypothetical protein